MLLEYMEKIIIASGPVIVKDGKALLDISGDDKFWKFCGGLVNKDESLKEAALRRAKEELGIDIEIINNEPFIMYLSRLGKEETDVILIHWLSECSGEIVPGEMVKEWAWLDITGIEKNDLAPNIIPTLKYFKFIR